MQDRCVVSVAFRQPYLTHSEVQEANIRMNSDCDFVLFRDELPMKGIIHKENIVSEFQKSLYGFKPHAIQYAIDAGYKKVIWLDPSVLPTVSVDVLFDALDKHPMIVRTGDQQLMGMVNKKALDWFRITDKELDNIKHVGGTIYAFNFNDFKAVEVFNLWKKSEEAGMFGNQDDFMASHWADEACMSLAMHVCGVRQYYEEKFTYANQKDL